MIVPTGVESCEFRADVYSHPQADETFVADWMEMYNKSIARMPTSYVCSRPGCARR